MNELKSYTEYAVSTPTADFVIGFDFNYGEDAVNVTVDNVPATEAGYTVVYLNETTIRLSPSVPSGVVRLQRETDIDTSANTFSAGAKFTAMNMDVNFEQLRYAQQEVRDGFSKLTVDQEQKFEDFKGSISYTELRNTVQEVHNLKDQTESYAATVETNYENSQALMADIETFAAEAEQAKVLAVSSATEAQQYIDEARTYVDTTVATQNAAVSTALTDQTNTVNTALSNLSTVASKFYPTLAEANSDIANISVNQVVNIGEVANGGLWYKATTGATSLTKSAYDPLTQVKLLIDPVKSETSINTLVLSIESLKTGVTNPSGNSSTQQNGAIGSLNQIYINEDIKTTSAGQLQSVTLNIRETTGLIKLVFLSKPTSTTWKVEKIVEINATGFAQYQTATFQAGEHFDAVEVRKDWHFGTHRTSGYSAATIVGDLNKTTLRIVNAPSVTVGSTLTNIGNLYQSAVQINIEVVKSEKLSEIDTELDVISKSALSNSFEIQSAKQFINFSDYSNTPIAKIANKIKTGGVAKTFSMGTSIANNTNSSVNKFEAALTRKFGKIAELSQCLGVIGGGVTGNYQGWLRQDFGGTKFLRLNGKPTSTAFVVKCAGDKLRFYYSKEIGGSSFILNVDGTDYTIDCSGTSQSYRNLFELTLENKGHVITFNPPTSGDVYVEWLEVWDSTKAGIVTRNATLGGSALAQTRNRGNTTGNPLIVTVGNNGIDSFFQDDVDLAIIEWHVNDTGSGTYVSSGQYFTDLTYLVGKYVAAKIPVIVITELSGHYRMPSNTYFESYKTAKKAIQRQAQAGVWVIDWDGMYRTDEYVSDISHFCRTFYTATYNDSNNTFTGDFIHPTDIGYRGLDDKLSEITKISVANDSTLRIESAKVYQKPNVNDMHPIQLSSEMLQAKAIARRVIEAGDFKQTVYIAPNAVNIQQSWKDSTITASTLFDEYGKYASPILSGAIIGKIFYMTPGEYWITFKASGLVSTRLQKNNGSLLFNDKETPSSGLVDLAQQGGYPIESEQPIYYTMKVRIVTAGNFEIRFNRIYDFCIVNAASYDLPVVN